MKRTALLMVGAMILALVLSSCDLVDLVGGGSGEGILSYRHTITSADQTYDSVADNYKIQITHSGFTGNYWAELWVKNSDGYLAKAAPVHDPSVDMWYMRIAQYPGALRFRNKNSMIGKEVCVFYSATGTD